MSPSLPKNGAASCICRRTTLRGEREGGAEGDEGADVEAGERRRERRRRRKWESRAPGDIVGWWHQWVTREKDAENDVDDEGGTLTHLHNIHG